MTDNMKKFSEAINADPALNGQLCLALEGLDPNDRAKRIQVMSGFAEKLGIALTEEDIPVASPVELSDDELEKASGGIYLMDDETEILHSCWNCGGITFLPYDEGKYKQGLTPPQDGYSRYACKNCLYFSIFKD